LRKVCCRGLWFGWVLFVWFGSAGAADLQVWIVPEKVYPGQAIWIELAAQENLKAVEGSFLGQQLRFFPEGEGRRWSALAAVGLTTAPKEHSFSYRVRLDDGTQVQGARKVFVREKDFPVERITVRKKYVDLSKKDLSRVHREKKMLGGLYRNQSPEAMWFQGFTVPAGNTDTGMRPSSSRPANAPCKYSRAASF